MTLVVLLILAAITLNLLFGETGIFNKAQQSEDAYKIGALKDQISTIILDWEIEKKIPNTTDDETIGTLEGLWDKFVDADIIDNPEEDIYYQEGTDIYEVTTNEGYVVEIIVKEDGTVEIGDIVKGDNLPPRIGEITSNGTSNSIHVEVNITRSTGEVKVSYYYKKDGEEDSSYKLLKENVEDLTADFEGLEQNVIYNIKVIVTDDNGSTAKVVNQLTGKLAEGTISQIGETQWSNGTATIQLETSQTGVSIVYQIEGIDGEWLPYLEEGISGLNHGDMVYAAISDGINVSKESSFIIKDEIAPMGTTINPSTTSTETGKSITATVALKDNESGVNVSGSKWVYNTTAGNIGTNAGSYTGGTFSQQTQTINLTASVVGTYYLHVLTVDNAGNAKETVSGAITVKTAIVSDGSYNSSKGVNTPDLADGKLTPIIWNGSNWVIPKNANEWYDYSTTEKKWANAVVGGTFKSNGTLDESATGYSMFVWIPRFAYQISSGYHSNSTGTINIKFMQGTSNTAADGYTSWNNASGQGNWNIHPAFEYNGTKAGIWVAKFEASHTGCTTNANTGMSNKTNLTLQVKPKVTAWRSIFIGNAFTVCQNYRTDLNSHMMKNSEWGACIYLSKSNYGKNEEMWVNNSGDYITGSAGNSVNAAVDKGTTNDYTSTQGQEASTTGTIYGIYDMSGGSWEFVAAYVDNNNANLNNYGSSLVSAANYMKDVYAIGSSDTREETYLTNAKLYGDAIYETSFSGAHNSGAWCSNFASLPVSDNPFFIRGNYCRNGLVGGYSYYGNEGGTSGNHGFRPVLSPAV